MRQYSYAQEKFYVAVKILASVASPIQTRVSEAWKSGLYRLNATHFPDNLWADFESLVVEVTSKKAVGIEGSIAITASKMTDDVASEHARRILSMFCSLVGFSG